MVLCDAAEVSTEFSNFLPVLHSHSSHSGARVEAFDRAQSTWGGGFGGVFGEVVDPLKSLDAKRQTCGTLRYGIDDDHDFQSSGFGQTRFW